MDRTRLMTTREALLSLAYREELPGRWAKPVGFHLFTYLEERDEWVNWFMDLQGKINTWESHTRTKEWTGEEFVANLRSWEAYTQISTHVSSAADFTLRAIDL